jgi:DNA-directed RNA polymerase subunit alpha
MILRQGGSTVLIVTRPQIQEETSSPTRSKFVIEPLQPGFGYTLGNALRRTLLSSIPGAAISSVRIDGVLHEFSSVPKVTEDVTDIILNLKGLVLRSEVDEPVSAYLKAKGPGEVTAGDIQPPARRPGPRCPSWSTCSATSPRARASRWGRRRRTPPLPATWR